MKRKPIQIQVTFVPQCGGYAAALIETVLCNDGTIWCKKATSDTWRQVVNIPQFPIEPQGEA